MLKGEHHCSVILTACIYFLSIIGFLIAFVQFTVQICPAAVKLLDLFQVFLFKADLALLPRTDQYLYINQNNQVLHI